MRLSTESREPGGQALTPGTRKKIGLIDSEPQGEAQTIERLTPAQQAMREAVINNFKSNKLRAYISEQLVHINSTRQIGDIIRFLFDENGRPPANVPLEEIIEERKKIETQLNWLEALCAEMRNNLVRIRQVEDQALELLDEFSISGDV